MVRQTLLWLLFSVSSATDTRFMSASRGREMRFYVTNFWKTSCHKDGFYFEASFSWTIKRLAVKMNK